MLPEAISQKLAKYLFKHHIQWPPKEYSLLSDEEKQTELIGMEPLVKPLSLEEAVSDIVAHAALLNNEDLRTAILLCRMTRPKGVFFWVLRFVYESRGYKLHDDTR